MPKETARKTVDSQPREIELKLAVSAHELPALRRGLARFCGGEGVEVETVYFDTGDALLRASSRERGGGAWPPPSSRWASRGT